ncbi:MAG TPA: hypothetical protein VM238_16425 [Phycisphaerae bacterium]|nr:hypothetical protein [Phycisphaerae bacterium]
MNPITEAHYVLPESVPTVLVYLMAVVAAGVWVLLHFVWRRPSAAGGRAVRFAFLTAVGFLTLLAVWQALQRGLVLATNWPLWPIALLGALAVEIVLALYALERRTVPRGAGLALSALRVAIVILVIIMLAQPVRPWNLDKTIQRWVAVLLDTSASMFVPDTQLGPAEKLRLAEALSVEGVSRPFALDRLAGELDEVGRGLSAQGEWLASLGNLDAAARKQQLEARRSDLNDAFTKADKDLAKKAETAAEPLQASLNLSDSLVKGLQDIGKRIADPVRQRLNEAVTLTGKDNAERLVAEHGRLLDTVRQAATELAALASKTAAMAKALDAAAYAALDPDLKSKVDALAGKKRLALARDVLLHRPTAPGKPSGEKDEAGKSLLDRLQADYGVKMFTFAGQPAEVELKAYAEGYKGPAEDLPGDAAALPDEQQQTDFTAVFEKVMTEMSDERLSGILVLTDGRHNATKSVEPLVRQLGMQQVPVSSIVLGGEKPPIDAGIISVEAPEAIATHDRMFVTAQVKLDGLAGKEVKVTLNDGDKTVDTETVRVPTDAYRARVQFADEPKEAGLHRYAISIEKFDGEVLTTNNEYPLAVSVSDERTQLLLIDGRPRWEFRYIKNLFASRDKTVHLQYVLLEPDRIEGVPLPPQTHASASREVEEIEATSLPKDEAEWMKFDVIVLGDVSSESIGEDQQQILRKFVTERGGTLIVVAGPLHTPHAYGDADIAEILPVTFEKSTEPIAEPPEKEFRIALTAEGRESVIMRQKVNPDENLGIWNELPEMHWRHPILHAKEGATVLAYAMPPEPPDFMPRPRLEGTAPDETPDEDILSKRRVFERERALITHHNVAMGKVMFLSFDRTWRLRYRIGDTYHHRFWGQVLRWATANKLPAGTETVKLGTDRTRYAPHASVRVQAKIAKKDFTPIVGSEDVAVNVYGDDKKPPNRHALKYVENSAGMYEADIGELESGTYRVELDAPAARPILAAENVDSVSIEFSVDPATPAEQVELTPDRGLLSRLATLTNGIVADPARADRVLGSLGPVTEVEIERHEYVIWDSVPLLVLIVLIATAEWLLRKKVGLA